MNIDYPVQSQIDDLKALWKEAFKDDDAFLEHFYTFGFSPDRCRCLSVDGRVAAALYWFDCHCQGKPLAYLYGVATAKSFRGKGMCRALVENTHSHLKQLGYAGELLVPAEEDLCRMYEKMGYTHCASVAEPMIQAEGDPVQMQQIDSAQYCRLRREYLPENGVVQEGDSIDFLQTMADFYVGEDFLVCISRDEEFFAPELLGNADAAPGILTAMRSNRGKFRMPGEEKPFAMYYPLSDAGAPGYFGLAFD